MVCVPVMAILRPVPSRLQRKRDQIVQELTVGDAAGLEELGVHGNGRKARNGVDLVEDDLAVCLYKEVDTGQAAAAHGPVDADGKLAHLLGGLLGNAGRDVQVCAVGDIFCVVVIEFRAGVDLAADGGKRIVVAEYGNLDLLPADEFLDQNLAVVFQRRLNCRFQRGAVLCLCNADGRAGSGGLDEDGIGEARLNGAQRRFPAAGKAPRA